LVGAVVAEMMASNRGLGFLISSAANQFDTGGVFAALVVLMIVSVSINGLVGRGESVLLRWKVVSR
ncbi:MAG: ABC transporter permease, partial [Chloroflexi bacterium]|nr:ABC transporter permease [Chloroflexota bacterium]